VGLLEVTRNRVYAEIILLGQTAGSPNPGTPRHLELYERRLVAATLNGDPLGIPDPVD